MKFILVIVILIISLLGVSCSKSNRQNLAGKQVDVTFSKQFWVSYLSKPQYQALSITADNKKTICFIDPSQAFNNENLGDNLKRRIESTTPPIKVVHMVENADGSFCVPRVEISSLEIDGKRVWGSGKAIGTQ